MIISSKMFQRYISPLKQKTEHHPHSEVTDQKTSTCFVRKEQNYDSSWLLALTA